MGTKSEPLVSIVTPVYNEAEHLGSCIESVLSQTYHRWNYTIVDNCSTDGSIEIARRYAEKDSRIRVHENHEFLKAIPNHNVALRQVSPDAKYCKVVLGDDWIFPECLERMVAVGEQYPSAGVIGAYSLEGREIKCVGLPYPSTLVGGREICRRHFLDRLFVFGSATSVLYRADLTRAQDPFYNESNIHADTEACLALLKTSDFGFVHQVLTFTRTRARSLSAISSDIQSDLPAMLHLLAAYGPNCLSRDELESCVQRHLSAYYRYLGKSLLFRRKADFWEYHEKKLAEAGMRLSQARLLRGALGSLWDAMLSPKVVMQKLGGWRDEWAATKRTRNRGTKRELDISQIE
jgi:glycosyltransferase involved in cell wall biosynthesis